MKREHFVLYSGAANGSESCFGEAAERHEIEEVNFSFAGHNDARVRGLRVLSQRELAQGDVSLSYVSKLMHRPYKNTPLFKSVLQSIWHQINNGQEIYVVGQILDDNTVKGGTGWGAEFAKLCNKPLFVFDQEQDEWFHWKEDTWEQHTLPRIGHERFAGTGTRFLHENGRAAIDALFDHSFA